MSGGSYNYAYGRIDDLADQIKQSTPERRAFVALLRMVAKAAHDIEWVDSCDYSEGRENAAIMACVSPGATLEAAAADLRAAMERALDLLAGLDERKAAEEGR